MKSLINYDVSSCKSFQLIRSHVLSAIMHRLSITDITEINKIPLSKLLDRRLDLREDAELTVLIDYHLDLLLNSIGVRSKFMQFPVNIRVLHFDKDLAYLRKDFNVDTVHCDHWSGAPVDSLNYFLYLQTSFASPKLVHYTVPDYELCFLKSYRGSHLLAPTLQLKLLNTPHYSGLLQAFPCTMPHKIDRAGSCVTISIDFRTRNLSNVFMEDISNKPIEAWVANKMTSLGVYWLRAKYNHLGLSSKVAAEVKASRDLVEGYLKMRRDYINRFYPDIPANEFTDSSTHD